VSSIFSSHALASVTTTTDGFHICSRVRGTTYRVSEKYRGPHFIPAFLIPDEQVDPSGAGRTEGSRGRVLDAAMLRGDIERNRFPILSPS